MGDGRKVRPFYNGLQKWILKNKFNLRSFITSQKFNLCWWPRIENKISITFLFNKKIISQKIWFPPYPPPKSWRGVIKTFLEWKQNLTIHFGFWRGVWGDPFFLKFRAVLSCHRLCQKIGQKFKKEGTNFVDFKNFWSFFWKSILDKILIFFDDLVERGTGGPFFFSFWIVLFSHRICWFFGQKSVLSISKKFTIFFVNVTCRKFKFFLLIWILLSVLEFRRTIFFYKSWHGANSKTIC